MLLSYLSSCILFLYTIAHWLWRTLRPDTKVWEQNGPFRVKWCVRRRHMFQLAHLAHRGTSRYLRNVMAWFQTEPDGTFGTSRYLAEHGPIDGPDFLPFLRTFFCHIKLGNRRSYGGFAGRKRDRNRDIDCYRPLEGDF